MVDDGSGSEGVVYARCWEGVSVRIFSCIMAATESKGGEVLGNNDPSVQTCRCC